MMNGPIKLEVSRQQLEKEMIRVEYQRKKNKAVKNLLLWFCIIASCIATVSVLWFPIVWNEDAGQLLLAMRTSEFGREDVAVFDSGECILFLQVVGTAGDRIIRDELGNLIHNGEVMIGMNVADELITVQDDHVLVMDKAEGKVYDMACEEIIGKLVIQIWPLPYFE